MNAATKAEYEPRARVSDARPVEDRGVVVDADEGYERWAHVYDDVPNPLLAREERHLLPALADLRDQSALDLACGTGRWLGLFLARGAKVAIGVDRSAAMLGVARGKSRMRQRLVEAACERLPFSNASFDFVVCSFALGHIADPDALAREIARVTRNCADIFVSDLHPDAHAAGWRVGFREGGSAVQIRTHHRPVEEVAQAFCSHGFECRAQCSLWLGEPERFLFDLAGKSNSFTAACGLPAVFVSHFRREGEVMR
ncbi:MAG TPA: class I SAM-dependent methyltransferase [Terriglobales bacterium]|nr:class I SAM-dependent methyltransferase [Terriglobales bacterium]